MTLRRADDQLKVALVTGACSGIGLELSKILGSLGYTLILASNRAAALDEVAASLRAQHGVAAHPVAIDLARAEAAGELCAAIEALGIEVDILVNNAGMFFFGEVADADPARANALLQLHVVTPSLLCTRLTRGMRERGRGQVLMVSSISAWRDFPGIGYYGSSKKYLRGFACSLRSELGPYGVNVTCLSPGATACEPHECAAVDALGDDCKLCLEFVRLEKPGVAGAARRKPRGVFLGYRLGDVREVVQIRPARVAVEGAELARRNARLPVVLLGGLGGDSPEGRGCEEVAHAKNPPQ